MMRDKEDQAKFETVVLVPKREVWLRKNEVAKKSVLSGLEQAKQMRLKSNIIVLDDINEKYDRRD